MTLTIPPDGIEVRVDSTRTGYGTTDFSIPAGDIISYGATHRAGKAMDEGTLGLHNDDAEYTTGPREITIGDKLIVVAEDATIETGYGEQAFGEGPFGSQSRLGTYVVLDWDAIEHPGGKLEYQLKLADFVFGRMSAHDAVFYAEVDKQLSGTGDSILNELLSEFAPEINQSALPTIIERTDYFVNGGKSLRKVVDELARIAAGSVGPILQTSFGAQLVFQPIEEIVAKHSDPLPTSAFGPWSTASESDQLANRIRLTGGIDDENNIDDEQTVVDHYYRVTDTDRLTTRVDTRKDEISKVELWTQGDNTSEDGVRVRFQVDDGSGTGPIAPGDVDSDLVTGRRRKVALNDDGWTTFNMGEHGIKERNPWLIIDSDGSTGHDVGVDVNDVPAYRAHFPKPVAAVMVDGNSQNEFGEYEQHVRNESLVTNSAVRDRATAELARRAQPGVGVGPLIARDEVAHRLRVGDIIPFDRPELKADGEFIVTQRTTEYDSDSNQIQTDLAFEGVATFV